MLQHSHLEHLEQLIPRLTLVVVAVVGYYFGAHF